ncbi:MAG: YbaB/EbfC family nucleoid-associated protein [Dehalococcoidia bacterium]|nr:YbaB/EbfC family nucleoid-associated protein [Dehalococcoidia bacterium]
MDLSTMKQALELRSKLEKAKKELGKMSVEADSGRGAVKVVASGDQKILSIKIAPEAVNPAKVGDLEKLVLKATNEALEKSLKMAASEMKKLTGDLNIPGLS